MKPIIIVSKKDKAGMNIKKQLEKLKINIPIVEVDKEIIYAENIDKSDEAKDSDFIIFASKHASEKEKPSLCVHPIGNFHKASFGGKSEKLCPTSSNLLKTFFKNLNKIADKEKLGGYEITMECTHHGPYVEKPCLFIEIGSSEQQWQDEKAARVIAETIQASIKEIERKLEDEQNQKTTEKFISTISIGGKHYCHNFNKIQLNSNYSIGHIIPEYSLPVSENLIKQALDKTQEHPKLIILDWKGLGKSQEKAKLLSSLKKLNIKIMRTSEIEK